MSPTAFFLSKGRRAEDFCLPLPGLNPSLGLDGKHVYHYTTEDEFLVPKNVKMKAYKTIILPVFMYSCETGYLAIRK
jgi:hypothetical protein